MAACNLPTTLTSAKCFTNNAITPHQQKLFMAYLYFTWAEVVGATSISGGAAGLTEFAKCYQVLTDDQVGGVELEAVINGIDATSPGTGSDITVAELQALTACIAPLSDRELDRIIVALKCALFGALT